MQKIGPDFVRARVLQAELDLLPKASRHAGLLSLLLASVVAVSFLALNVLFPVAVWRRYAITWPVVAATACVAALQVSSVFDWALVAMDRQRPLFLAAIVFVMLTGALFLLAAHFGSGATGFLLAFAGARLAHLTMQIMLIRRR